MFAAEVCFCLLVYLFIFRPISTIKHRQTLNVGLINYQQFLLDGCTDDYN